MNIQPILVVAILSAATAAARAASVQILHKGRIVAALVTDKEVSRISAENVKTTPDGSQVHARGQVEIRLGQGEGEATIRAEEVRILK